MPEEGVIKGEYRVIRKLKNEILQVETQKPSLYDVLNIEVSPTSGEKKIYFTFHKTGRSIQYVYISVKESPVYFKFIPPKEEELTENILSYFILNTQDYIFDIKTVGFYVKPLENASTTAKLQIVAFY